MPTSSPNPMQGVGSGTWVLLPNNHFGPGKYNAFHGLAHNNLTPQWCSVPSTSTPIMVDGKAPETDQVEMGSGSRTSIVKDDTLKKRIRRAAKRDADEEARRRELSGKRPYTVQVRPSGMVDSGCEGHLRWQENIRDLTPRMLDMSVIKYEDQNVDSREKLREALLAPFECLDHEITQISLDRMIKTWLRREREKVKRVYGHWVKPPDNYSDSEWAALKNYWASPDYREKSDKMSETRRKVVHNPRLGRHGYAGKAAKLVSFLLNILHRISALLLCTFTFVSVYVIGLIIYCNLL